MNQKVFVNRILNMKKIKYIGLDMDHTLIRYNTRKLEELVYSLVVDRLIKDKQYPEGIRQLTFHFEDAIRGLVIDSRNGNLLKLSRFAAIRQSYHGTQLIDYNQQQKMYRSTYVDLADSNYIAIDTSFSIAFAVLYAQLVDYKDEHPAALSSYYEIAQDVLYYVDTVHIDGSLKELVKTNLEHYIIKDKQVVEGLKWYLHHGKKLFILTNSDYYYTQILLDFAINPFLDQGQSWKDIFEYVITMANKPRFFYDNLKFLRINPADGTMTNLKGAIVPGIYQGGCAKKFTDDLKLVGDDILYIGDHIYGDIVRLKKDCNWRTALVVEELGEEVASQLKAQPIEANISKAMAIKKIQEQQYTNLCTQRIDEHSNQYDEAINELQRQLISTDEELASLLRQQHQFYNARWDRVFRAGAEESYFAYQVERFACIYMEKLADLLMNSPITYFRANRRSLAHDIEDTK